MPIDPGTATVIASGIGALSGAANATATGKMNKKSRQFSRETYAKTKADNIQFWNMQNEYNSPQKQMERLKAAGLNPNMVYDKGGAIQAAGNISSPDVQPAQFRTPDFGSIGTGLVQGYFDTKIKQAQYDNLKATNTVLQQEAILKAAQSEGESMRNYGKGLENYVYHENVDALIRGAYLANEKTAADIQFTNDENARKAAMQAPNLQQAIIGVARASAGLEIDKEQLKNLQQQVYNAKQEGIIKKVQAGFAEMGVNFNDPLVMRWIGDYIGGFTKGFQGSSRPSFEGKMDSERLKKFLKY
jgi:hypothetical protein